MVLDGFQKEFGNVRVQHQKGAWVWIMSADEARSRGMDTGYLVIPEVVRRNFRWDGRHYRHKENPSIRWQAYMQGAMMPGARMIFKVTL
jgi:hypothetical protein